jgi:hypothetical protein
MLRLGTAIDFILRSRLASILMRTLSGKPFFSFRYGASLFNSRTFLIRLFGLLQGKRTVVLNSDPQACGEILAHSVKKGTFIEHLFATPAWEPVYSIESMDGEVWEQLSADFKDLLSALNWRTRLPQILAKETDRLKLRGEVLIDSSTVSIFSLRVLYELLFGEEISGADEALFYQASIEWRREIALKGRADQKVKHAFWQRLTKIVETSSYQPGLVIYARDPARFLSLFAQPFLLSPQINVSDILASVFIEFRKNGSLFLRVKKWVEQNDRTLLDGVILESIRLHHPFPILEREMNGTQYFILLDQFQHDDPTFLPERWLAPASENAYSSLPFAAGPRMCIGKPVAMELMGELLKVLVRDFPLQQVWPESGHAISGRNNDGQKLKGEGFYQLKLFVRALWTCVLLRRKKVELGGSAAPWGKCPWKQMTEGARGALKKDSSFP